MILSKKRITKVLIRLRGCAGWSAPLLFANPKDRFSRILAIYLVGHIKGMFKLILDSDNVSMILVKEKKYLILL